MLKRFFSGIWRAITVVRMALANLLFLALLVVVFMVLRDSPEPLPERAALVLDPVGRVVDQRSRVEAAALLVEVDPSAQEVVLTDLIDSVRYAAEDERITSLVLDLSGLVSIGQSRTTELAEAIEEFAATGKPVVAVADYFSQDQYRLAVEADTILMHPYGGVGLEGFSVYTNYFADALEKLSITVHVFRAGEFKSIAEPLLRSDMSEGERAVTQAWLDDLWRAYVTRVEDRRELDPGTLNALLADYPRYLTENDGDPAKLAKSLGLVDELMDREEQSQYLTALAGARDEEGEFAGVSYADYLPRASRSALLPGAQTVAIVTAQGNMLPGTQPPGTIGGDSLATQLRETADRDGTAAIVLRVTSGGGSVFASEIIREEIARIRDEGTPVVVSMGSVAASGAYYIATAADYIMATPTSITGSIGVFAAFPTAERLLARGGVYTDGVATSPIAGGLRPDRPLNAAIKQSAQLSIQDIYEKFLAHVMESRNLDRATMDSLAQGRVFSAEDALASGLIDRLGSLWSATAQAAEMAGLADDEYEVISIHPAFSPRDMLLQQLTETLKSDSQPTPGISLLSSWIPESWLRPVVASKELLDSFTDPQHLYMRCFVCEL